VREEREREGGKRKKKRKMVRKEIREGEEGMRGSGKRGGSREENWGKYNGTQTLETIMWERRGEMRRSVKGGEGRRKGGKWRLR
jgi:hypothetical protein